LWTDESGRRAPRGDLPTFDQTNRRWDSASDIRQAIFKGFFMLRRGVKAKMFHLAKGGKGRSLQGLSWTGWES
jgi:hypothetical protein